MPDILTINLENCYGIGKLQAELRFKHRGYAIYAPNGVMKTSFAKTMSNMSAAQDLVFSDRESVCDVKLNGKQLNQEEVLVVRSQPDEYSPNKAVSTLLANSKLKKQYEEIHLEIEEAKKNLDKSLREFAGFGEKSRENIDLIFNDIFGKPYYDALLELEDELNTSTEEAFSDANYKIIFNKKVVQLLQEELSKKIIEKFAVKYDEITERSPILRKEFQHHNLYKVYKGLDENNFLSTGHSINLSDKSTGEKTEFTDSKDLLSQIESEKTRVLNDPELIKNFNAFNNKLKNKELEAFRDYITENKHILPELTDLQRFKRKLWVQYLLKSKEEYAELIRRYKTGQDALKKIISEAIASKNDWDEVIISFNRRFLHLPFKLSVKNKADVILKDNTPSIEFDFFDGDRKRIYNENQKGELLKVLSTGEARALYILNIMFEIYTRWKLRTKTLFIFDDIADSFDYKNKFAIIDYLSFIVKSEDTNFLAIILTHNFDFLRTIESRDICITTQCRMAFKNNGEVTLNDFKRSDIRNPFHKWQGRLSDEIIQVAYIPFLRNIIEYTQGIENKDGEKNQDYLTLTQMLHYKDGTKSLRTSDYKKIFDKTLKSSLPIADENKNILDYVECVADQCIRADDGINLEHKVVLSIAIRIFAEKYMIDKIRDNNPDYDPTEKQMGYILQDFINTFNNLKEDIQFLKRVNLITPANIHINSFMYEPILDMGFYELKDLYKDVKKLFRAC